MAKKTSKNTSLIIISLFTLILIILLLFTIARTTGFADEIFKSKAESKLSDSKVTEDLEKLDSNPEEIKEINNSEVKTETIVEKEPEEKPIEKIIESEVIEVPQAEFKIDEKELAKQKQLLELSSKDNITIEYSYEKPVMSKDSENKDIITISKLNNLNKPGEPEVPFEVVMIMLPADKDVDKITVIPDNKIDIKGTYDIKTGDWQVPISQAEKIDILELEKNKTIFNKYPNSYYSNPSTQIKKGYKFVIFNLYPVEYQQKKQKLSYYQKFTVVVTLKPGDVPKSFRASNIEDKKEIQNWVISQNSNLRAENLTYEKYQEISRAVADKTNLSALYTYTGESKQKTNGRNQPNIPDTVSYKYIIVTKRQFSPSFQPLIIWKSHRPNNPITAKIFYMEDILVDPRFSCTGEYNWGDGCGSLNQFNDDAAKLRNFIRFAYTTYDTEYVLLGGDADYQNLGPGTETEDIIVPSRYLGLLNSNEIILSDMYFSNLDGSFNPEDDGVFRFYYNQTDPNNGIPIENTDYLTDVAIGRAPFDNTSEITNWINKVIGNEQIVDYQNLNYLFLGEFLDFGGITHFAGPNLDEIVNGSINCGINTTGFSGINQNNIYRLYDNYQNYNPPQAHGFSPQDLINLINLRNPYIINHFGHGSVNDLMKFYNGGYVTPEFLGLTATQYFINSQACYSGSFDNKFADDTTSNKDSISEEMLSLENGPFSMITNSRFGHGAAYSLCGQSQIMQRIFWSNAFTNQNKNLGKLNNLSKENYLANQGFSYVYLETNLLGDPETKLILPTVNNKLSVDLSGPILDSVYYQEDFNVNININNLINTPQSNVTLHIYLDNQEISNQSIILNPGENQISYILSHNLYSLNIGEYKRIKVIVGSNLSGDANYDNVFEKDLFIYNTELGVGEENNIYIIDIDNQIVDCNTSFGQQLFGVNTNKIAYKGDFRLDGGNYILRNCEFISFAGDMYGLYFINNQNIVLENNIFKQISIEFKDFNIIDINSNLFYVNYYNSQIYQNPNFITQNSIEYNNVVDVVVHNNIFNPFNNPLELDNINYKFPTNYIRNSQRIEFIQNKLIGVYGGVFLENVNDINIINNNFYLSRTLFNQGEIGSIYNKYAVAIVLFPSSNLNIVNNNAENMHFYLDNVNNVDFNKNTLKNSRLFVSQGNDVVLYKNRSLNNVLDEGLIFRGYNYGNARVYITDSNILEIVDNYICLSRHFDYPGINLLLNCNQLSTLDFINNIISSISIQSLENCPELLPQHGVNYCYCNEKFAPGGVGCVSDPNYQNTLEMEN